MKKNINEQTTTSIDLKQARDTYKCPFVLGSTFITTSGYADGVMKRTANTASKTPEGNPVKNFEKGDVLYIKSNYTYDVYRDKILFKSNLKWACSTLDTQQAKVDLSQQQQKSVDDLIAKYPGYYMKEKPTADQIANGEWTQVNLKERFPIDFKFDYYIYEKSGLRQTKTPQQEQIIKTYLAKGWKDLGGKLNPAEEYQYNSINLKDEYPSEFPESYLLVQSIESVDTNELFGEMNVFVRSRNFSDKKTCRKGINTYFTLFNKSKNEQIPIDNATLTNWKNAINSCDNKIKNFNDLNITNNRLNKLREDSARLGLAKKTTEGDIQKEQFVRLKKSLKESLSEIKKQKHSNLIKESKIVKNRFKFISENVSLKTKKQKDKFCGDLLNEMIYLNSQGYDKQVIKEQFFDILKSLFGNAGESIQQYFKEYFAEWLISSLTPLDPNGWIGGTIIKAIGNLAISDISKLTDCNFTTKLISKSIADEAIDQLKNKAGMEGAFYDILRNAVVESLFESDLGQKIESALGNILCPSLSKVSSKMSDITDTMKKGALSLS